MLNEVSTGLETNVVAQAKRALASNNKFRFKILKN